MIVVLWSHSLVDEGMNMHLLHLLMWYRVCLNVCGTKLLQIANVRNIDIMHFYR